MFDILPINELLDYHKKWNQLPLKKIWGDTEKPD